MKQSRWMCALQGRHWVLDPIDGTRGFVGMRQYAVCLGLLDAGQACPARQPRTLLLTYFVMYMCRSCCSEHSLKLFAHAHNVAIPALYMCMHTHPAA